MNGLLTSERLEKMELEDFEPILEHETGKYRLTTGELGWLDWIGGRYSIAVYIRDNMEDGVLSFDTWEIGKALHDDGVDRAPCLCDSTQLQRLLWYVAGFYEDVIPETEEAS